MFCGSAPVFAVYFVKVLCPGDKKYQNCKTLDLCPVRYPACVLLVNLVIKMIRICSDFEADLDVILHLKFACSLYFFLHDGFGNYVVLGKI